MSTTASLPPIDELLRNPDRVVLHNVPWEAYVGLRDDDAYRHVRMSYYQGTLELVSPRCRHEKFNRRIDRLVWELVVELGIPCACAGSTNLRRENDGAGKESDTCFYIAHEPLIRDKDEIDLDVDPPPDLAIEVDDTRDSEGDLPIYAALRVPEVWRCNARTGSLWFGRVQDDGTYDSIARSECLPLLTPERVLEASGLGCGVPESR